MIAALFLSFFLSQPLLEQEMTIYDENITQGSYDDTGYQDDYMGDNDSSGDTVSSQPEDAGIGDSGVVTESPQVQDFLDFLNQLKDSGLNLSEDGEHIDSSIEGDLEGQGLQESLSADDILQRLYDSPEGLPVTLDNIDDLVQTLATYDTYYGSISTQYIEYAKGFLQNMKFTDSYVFARTSQYNYTFAFGGDLVYGGNGLFSSSSPVTVVTFSTYGNGSYTVRSEQSFQLRGGSNLVFTNLTSDYPALVNPVPYDSVIMILLLLMCAFGFVKACFGVVTAVRAGKR